MRYLNKIIYVFFSASVITFSLSAGQVSAFEDVSFVNEIRLGFKQPADAAVSSSRNLYVLDSKLCTVSIVDSAGYLMKVFGRKHSYSTKLVKK